MTDLSFSHELKVRFWSVVTFDGTSKLSNLVYENVDSPREKRGEFGGNLIVWIFSQNSKTLLPNSVTVGGIIIFSIELNWNASSSIFWTLVFSGNITLRIFLLLRKDSFPMHVITYT